MTMSLLSTSHQDDGQPHSHHHNNHGNPNNRFNTTKRAALSLRRLPPSLSIDSAQTPTNRPLTVQEQDSLSILNRLKEFLATAPTRWSPPDDPTSVSFPNQQKHPALNRFSLPSGEYVTCVLWQGLYHITGTDIVRALVFRFEAFGRPVRNMKKFEEGVFSDLRNLKPGADACLEEPKSSFLDLLYKYQCIRTQKKQKVFYWYSVPHDRLFLDALERDLKREKVQSESATALVGEPALSFRYDGTSGKTLWEEWMLKVKENKAEMLRSQSEPSTSSSPCTPGDGSGMGAINSVISSADRLMQSVASEYGTEGPLRRSDSTSSALGMNELSLNGSNSVQQHLYGGMLELFEGSPSYKQRRKKRVPGPGGPVRLNSRDQERGRGVRKSSRDPEEEMDPSVGVPTSDSGIRRSVGGGGGGDVEMARRELQESFGTSGPERAESPATISTLESRSSTSSPEERPGVPADKIILTHPSQGRSLSYGGTPTTTTTLAPRVPQQQQQSQQASQTVPPSRHSYHPYNHYPQPQQQHRHTLPVPPPTLNGVSGGVIRAHKPSGLHFLPHHANTLPTKMHMSNAISRTARRLPTTPTISPSSPFAVAFICPLQPCARLFKDPEQWRRHVAQHVMDGVLDAVPADLINSCQVEISASGGGEEFSDTSSSHPQFAHLPPGTPEPSPYLTANPAWSGTSSRPTSSGFASSPGSVYSGPPSSHSPSPPSEHDPVPHSRQGSVSVKMEGLPPRSPATSLQLPAHASMQHAMSAPSYKQNFDHGNLYPRGYHPSPMAGPISRPRSALPEMHRGPEVISRPTTSMSYNGSEYFPAAAVGPVDVPSVNYSGFSPASATTNSTSTTTASAFTSEDSTTAQQQQQSGRPTTGVYERDVQYRDQMAEIINLDAATETAPVGSGGVVNDPATVGEYHSSPEIDMDVESSYVQSGPNNATVANHQPGVVVSDYVATSRYHHMDSPPDVWGAPASYHASPESGNEAISPPSMPIITTDIETGMTAEEAIQLFADS